MGNKLENFIEWLTHPGPDHIVDFYSSDNELISNLKAYLTAGVENGDNCMVIATPDHIRQLREAFGPSVGMTKSLFDDNCAIFNANAMLNQFMVNGLPNEKRFYAAIGSLVEKASKKGQPIRAYGEMVAVLWEAGNKAGAIALEELWNKLAQDYSFSLYCAYPEYYFEPDEENATQSLAACHDFTAPHLAFSNAPVSLR